MEYDEGKCETVVVVEEPEPRASGSSGNPFAKCVGSFFVFFSMFLMIITFPLSLVVCIRMVSEYQRAVVFRLGRIRMGKARGPGLIFILPCVDVIRVVDLRTTTCVVPPQDILTKDSVTVSVDAVVFHRVRDPLNAVVKVNDYKKSTDLLAASTLRNVLGTGNFSNILIDRDTIANEIKDILDNATHPWGIQVERVEIKDVKLPYGLQRAMAAEAEATREARAKIIAADGEKKASKSLKEASDIMSQSKTALQLRYLQTLNDIAQVKQSNILFPIPIDIMGGFFGNGK